MTKRRRQSRRISRMVDMKIAYPNNGQAYPSVTPGPFLFSGNSLKQQTGESELAYHLRLQNEIDEITELHGVICQMIDVHNQLAENIDKALPESEKAHEMPSLIGDALMLFADKILQPYITYSIVTLVGMKKPSETRNFSEGEVNTIVSRIVTKFIGEHYIEPENGGPAASSSSKVPSQLEWEMFLRRPIQRLEEYQTALDKIMGFETMTVEGNNDNIKIKVAKIKVQSIIKSIQDRLSIMRPWTKEDFMEMDIYDFTN